MQPTTNRSVRVVTSLLTPAPDKREELLQTLRSLRDQIAREPGCVVCAVCQDIDGGDHFVVLSEWRSQAELMTHLDSEHFRVLSGASRLLGATAEFRFVTSSASAAEASTRP
jgi:quinol monooxygenase YgiN